MQVGELRGAEVELVHQRPQASCQVPSQPPDTVQLLPLLGLQGAVAPALAQQLHGLLRARHAAVRLGQKGGGGGVESRQLQPGQLGGSSQVTEAGVDLKRMDLNREQSSFYQLSARRELG